LYAFWRHSPAHPLQSSVFGAVQVGNVSSYVPDISSAKGAGSDVIKLIDFTPEIDAESTEGKIIPTDRVQGQIRLENIHFRYPTRPGVRVLCDLSLTAEPGTYIALVGASGSGKSTMSVNDIFIPSDYDLLEVRSIQLIERFYNPLAGQIYVCGIIICQGGFLTLPSLSLITSSSRN
jgi:ATP-binding cassette subfamily B (MDR/TAP) protein 1